MLKKLQFLFELPSRLRLCVEKKSYEQAVEYYTKASGVLNQYRNMDSFRTIYDECSIIMQQLKAQLGRELDSKTLSQRELVAMFELLKRLSDKPAQVTSPAVFFIISSPASTAPVTFFLQAIPKQSLSSSRTRTHRHIYISFLPQSVSSPSLLTCADVRGAAGPCAAAVVNRSRRPGRQAQQGYANSSIGFCLECS